MTFRQQLILAGIAAGATIAAALIAVSGKLLTAAPEQSAPPPPAAAPDRDGPGDMTTPDPDGAQTMTNSPAGIQVGAGAKGVEIDTTGTGE